MMNMQDSTSTLIEWNSRGSPTQIKVSREKPVVLVQNLDLQSEPGRDLSVQVNVEPGAYLQHLILCQNADGLQFNSHFQIRLGRDSRYTQVLACLGTNHTQVNMELHHEDEGSHADLVGLNVLQGESEYKNKSIVTHHKPHATTKQTLKSVLSDTALSHFSGKIRIEKEAQKSDCEQLAKSILIGSHARAVTQPELEILADDVRAKHGATVGQLSSDEVFYLQSRGFTLKQAQAAVLGSFLLGEIESVESALIRQRVVGAVRGLV